MGSKAATHAQHAALPRDKAHADAPHLSSAGDRKSAAGESGVESLVERNVPLVKYVLSKVARNLPPHVDRDDLLAAGLLGLTEAAQRFDAGRKVPFHSYAIPRIWGAMLDELRRYDWLSSDLRGQVKRLRKSVDDARQKGRAATAEELAEDLHLSADRLTWLLALSKADRRSSSEGETLNAEVSLLSSELGLRAPRNPYEQAEFSDQKRVLAEAIRNLPEREGQVIVLRYHENLMLQEIGKVLDVTASRACQLHTQALQRLKRALSRAGLGLP
jgi:RNA polymerase sigma factor for flagellar operon FliA